MRVRLALIFVVLTPLNHLRAQSIATLEQEYVAEATNVARQVLVAEFSKHPERIHHLSITFIFQVDARGRAHNVKVASKTRDAWAVDTARRALTVARYPAIPKQIVQTGADLVKLDGDFSANAP
jgi:hypothetical protein